MDNPKNLIQIFNLNIQLGQAKGRDRLTQIWLDFGRVDPVRNLAVFGQPQSKFGPIGPGPKFDCIQPSRSRTNLTVFSRVGPDEIWPYQVKLATTEIWLYVVVLTSTKIRLNSVESAPAKIWPSWSFPNFGCIRPSHFHGEIRLNWPRPKFYQIQLYWS